MDNRICVVGAGRWGKNHIRTLHSLGALGGVVETNSENRKWVETEFPGVPTYHTVTEALAEPYRGFTVATPAETHVTIAQEIIQARRHVLVEKPLALSSADASRLNELAKKYGVFLMVGHVMLFHPAVRKIRDLIQAGKLGRIEYVYANRVNLGTVRKEENILWSFAPHDISIFQYLLGTRPVEVTSRGAAFVQPRIQDSTMTLLQYPNNIMGHIFVSWLHPFKEHRLVVIGDKGMISFDDAEKEKNIYFYEKGIDWVRGEPIKRDGATEIVEYTQGMPLTDEISYFCQCVAENRAPEIANGDNGVEVLEILERATESLLEKQEASESTTSEVAERATNSRPQIAGDYFAHETAYVDEGAKVGKGTKIWHFSHVQPNSVIGENCSLGQNVNVANNVRIGNGVKIQNNVSVYEGVELEDYVFCGPSMVFTNINVPRCKYPQRGSSHYLRTLVREGASLGANSTIVCGSTIGRHALIAAGAVVTKDVPDHALMVGVPARQVGWICECGERLDVKSKDAVCECKKCGLVYHLLGDEELALVPEQAA
ncbi:MAG: Gfo/Idh/MocA family oxidoreductase [Bdellovibrionales bacterium]|nr:Gfo/Idh/MocA family oxidoreductase [Bdellovibrionales bacterium]